MESTLQPTAQYNANNRVTWTTVNAATGGFTYDASGNVINDSANSYIYDAEGRRVAKGTITTLSCDPSTNGFHLTASYVLDEDGSELTQQDGSGNWQRTNVYVAGKLLATYDLNGLHFHLTDPLGTRRMQVSGNLNTIGVPDTDIQSLPYGDAPYSYPDPYAPATADDATPLHFTGKERDSESGNDYFGARYYASSMGRFLSPDWSAKVEPVPYAKLDNPQSLNLYAYVDNNPLSSFDPDGHLKCVYCAQRLLGMHLKKDVAQQQNDGTPSVVVHAKGPSLLKRAVAGILSWAVANNHTLIAGFLTRYMGAGEAATALRTGSIPNTGADGNPRPTHFTSDEPMNDPNAVQQRYTLPQTPAYRATVPEERVPNARVPEAGPTTEGGGSQVITDEPVPVSPSEIFPLAEPIVIDPF